MHDSIKLCRFQVCFPMFFFAMCFIELLFSWAAFWPCHPSPAAQLLILLLSRSEIFIQMSLSMPSAVILVIQNFPNSSSSKPFKYKTALLGQLSGKVEHILLSNKHGSQLGCTPLVGTNFSDPSQNKDRDLSLWMASLGRCESPWKELQESKAKTGDPD